MPVHTIDWYRTPLDSELLKSLNQRSDLMGFLQAGGHLLSFLATGTMVYLAFLYLHWAWMIPLLLLHGFVSSFMINAVHELVHGTVFKTKSLNVIFSKVFSFIGWINDDFFWASHTEHHKYTLHPPDDMEVVLPVPHSMAAFLRMGIFNPLGIWPSIKINLRIAQGKLEGQWEHHILPEDAPKTRKRIRHWSRNVIIGHAAIVVIALALTPFVPGIWLLIPLITFAHTYGGFIHLLCNNTQHAGLIDYVPDFRLCCRTVKINPVFRFFYWHMNWHIEHHMYAGVPCYKLSKLHKAIKHELPYCPNGLMESWAQIFHIQQIQKEEPSYQYIQALPGQKPSEAQFNVTRTATAGTVTAETPAASNSAADTQETATLNSRGESVRQWECQVCGFIYDESVGLPEEGIAAGTAWLDIPDDWSCPDCGVAKSDFDMLEITSKAAASTGQAAQPHHPNAIDPSNVPTTPLVIIGSGLAGYSLAKEIRGLGVDRPITLLTRDSGAFYSKPMLSNALHEDLSPEALVKDTPEAMAQRFNLTVKHGVMVTAIDRTNQQVVTEQGNVPYGQLVMAVGADQITLTIEGSGAARVHQVNDLESYAEFRKDLPEQGNVMLIGAGLIGCEFANDLAGKGLSVHVADIAPQALGRLVPQQVASAVESALTEHGVTFHLESSVERIDETDDGKLSCKLTNGQTIIVDTVLSAVGLRPRINLAVDAELKVNRGIVVDDELRTSDPDIFALGDCAEVSGRVLPFIHPLFEGARTLAKTLSGQIQAVKYPVMPVVVKTPACPLVTCPPEPGESGQWIVEGEGRDLVAKFVCDDTQSLRGFALTGSATQQRHKYAKQIETAQASSTPSSNAPANA